MDAWTVVCLVLACRAVVDCLAEGSLFAAWRTWWQRWPLLGELWRCRFCLTFHASFWLALLWSWFFQPGHGTPGADLTALGVLWLATAGGSLTLMRWNDHYRDPEQDLAIEAIAHSLDEEE